MNRLPLTLLLCLMLSSAMAAEVEGVKLADKVRVNDSGPELVLNGAGVRTRVVFKVYVAALYLAQTRNTPAAILSDAGPKRVALHLMREVTAEQLFGALGDGLKNNHTPEQLAKLEPQVKQLESIFTNVKVVKSGDVVLLDYAAGGGTRVLVNGDAKGAITGDEFFTALLRVWLGDKPAEDSLKKAMLGG